MSFRKKVERSLSKLSVKQKLFETMKQRVNNMYYVIDSIVNYIKLLPKKPQSLIQQEQQQKMVQRYILVHLLIYTLESLKEEEMLKFYYICFK